MLIINDGLSYLDRYIVNAGISYTVKDANKQKSPACMRQQALEYAIANDYDNFIFADCDDVCLPDRISLTINNLENNDIVFNDMYVIDANSNIISNSYYTGRLTKKNICFTDFMEKNYIGLSNVGIRTDYLKYCLPIYSEIIAVDWWIASNVLLNTNRIGFIEMPLTAYRQHDCNTVGANNTIDEKMFSTAIKVKKVHYANMAKKYERIDKRTTSIFLSKYNEILELEKCFDIKEKRKEIMHLVNIWKKKYAWWEYAISLDKLEEIKNEICNVREI